MVTRPPVHPCWSLGRPVRVGRAASEVAPTHCAIDAASKDVPAPTAGRQVPRQSRFRSDHAAIGLQIGRGRLRPAITLRAKFLTTPAIRSIAEPPDLAAVLTKLSACYAEAHPNFGEPARDIRLNDSALTKPTGVTRASTRNCLGSRHIDGRRAGLPDRLVEGPAETDRRVIPPRKDWMPARSRSSAERFGFERRSRLEHVETLLVPMHDSEAGRCHSSAPAGKRARRAISRHLQR